MKGYLGEIRYFAGSFAPLGWAFCQGQSLTVNQYEALYSIIGNTYTTASEYGVFNLPDLRGRVGMGAGSGKGLNNYQLGYRVGTELVTLTQAEMPAHTHETEGKLEVEISLKTSSTTDTDDPDGGYLGEFISHPQPMFPMPYSYDANGEMKSAKLNIDLDITFNSVGGGQSHYNMQPYNVVNYIICIEGYYPQGVKK